MKTATSATAEGVRISAPRTRSRADTIRRITVAGIASAIAAVTFTGVATPAYAQAETNALHQNEQLNPGQRLITSNGIALGQDTAVGGDQTTAWTWRGVRTSTA